MRIAAKTTIVFVVIALAPLGLGAALMMPRYSQAIRLAERRYQVALAKQAAELVEARVARVVDDAQAIAGAITFAAKDSGPASEAAMRAVLATRSTVDVARIEIPSKSIDTVLSKAENDASLAPRSTEEMRAEAETKGVAVRQLSERESALTVLIAAAGDKPVKAYLTVPLHLQPLQQELADLPSGTLDGANVVITDDAKRVVAATGSWGLVPGDDASKIAFSTRAPDGAMTDVGLAFTYPDPATGEEIVACMVIDQRLGWTVGIARPASIAYAELYALTTRLAILGGGVILLAGLVAFASARAVVRPILRLAEKAARIGRRAWREVGAAAPGGDEIAGLDRAMVQMATDIERTEDELAREAKLRGDLSRFMSQELVDGIVRGEQSLELGGERRAITVLFADVVAFTPFAESRKPEQTVALLNELFSVLTEVVFRHGGVVDKFIGDSIMAVWGAPVAQADHAVRALRAADDMMRFLETAAEEWKSRYDVEVRLGVGVNSGEAIVGNIGSKKRMEYTVIGDVVNIAARLESIARPNQVLVGEATVASLTDGRLDDGARALRKLGAERLSGRSTETLVYELEI